MDALEYPDDTENIEKCEKALKIMFKMGYKEGVGLGKAEQGILEPIDLPLQVANRGFGTPTERCIMEKWNSREEDTDVVEELVWIECGECEFPLRVDWLEKGPQKTTMENETEYCDSEMLQKLIATKQEVFEEFDSLQLSKARTRANPFETIRSAFFMNRAALKMANIDAATNFMFSNIDKHIDHKSHKGPYYFADVCAGPGGFSEYILWRKKWGFKGFGFTLKGVHDFKVYESTCCSGVTFQAYYGALEDGNVCHPENIKDFTKHILHETDGDGVHFMMADGGFSVEGNENLQEILSKQIYVCQCLVALEILRKQGHFVTKLFDTFTPFSVGLIFLMHQCFDKITIFKPKSSRPANSERYLICNRLKDSPNVSTVRNYLRKVVDELFQFQDDKDQDIICLVPREIIDCHKEFKSYITDRNNKLGKTQMWNLAKLAIFCRNPSLIEGKQEELRMKCLSRWQIPDKLRANVEKFTTEDLLAAALSKPEFLYVQPSNLSTIKDLNKLSTDIMDWTYCPLSSCRRTNYCNFYAGVGGSKVFRLQNHKWIKVKNLHLIKGTLLYGEMVQEKGILKKTMEDVDVKSLHVIDALRLGDTSLADLSFKERQSLVRVYCKAVNFECNQAVRVRPKPTDDLINILESPLVNFNVGEDRYYTVMPTLGLGVSKEYFVTNSILFLKTDETQFFNTTYVLRAQLFIDRFELDGESSKVSYETLIKAIESRR